MGHAMPPRGGRSRRERGPSMEMKDAQRRVDAWISQFEEGYWPPLSNLARLTEEVGELARLMNHRFGHKPKKPDEVEQELALELADVLFVLLVIANEQGIDLDDALERTLEKYRVRDGDRWTRREDAAGDAGA
jgi:NTP pyrophosphatase (non-canonical NTP hydrolase)